MTTRAQNPGIGGTAALFSFLGAIVGTFITLFLKSGSLHADMSYADLAATLLAAVGVIVAIFGGVLAIAALWGFAQMKQEAVAAASDAALAELREQIENGAMRTYMVNEIERVIAAEVNSPRMDRRIQERVDRIALGNPEDALLEDDEGAEQ